MMSMRPPVTAPLFGIAADALLTTGQAGGALSAELAQQRAEWLAQRGHAPPWRLLRSGLGFLCAPMPAPSDVATPFLPSDAVQGQALSLTLDSLSIAGATAAPILRALAQMALDLAEELDSAWVAWFPARMAYPRAFLAEQLAQWQAGGLIPLLAFVQFTEDAGGADVTRGLSFFGLPELRFTARPAMAKGDAVRRMVRMAYAMLADGQEGAHNRWDGDYDGLLPGERITVRRRGDMLNLTATMRG